MKVVSIFFLVLAFIAFSGLSFGHPDGTLSPTLRVFAQ